MYILPLRLSVRRRRLVLVAVRVPQTFDAFRQYSRQQPALVFVQRQAELLPMCVMHPRSRRLVGQCDWYAAIWYRLCQQTVEQEALLGALGKVGLINGLVVEYFVGALTALDYHVFMSSSLAAQRSEPRAEVERVSTVETELRLVFHR